MTMYHAVMIGEEGSEFGVDQEASSKEEARELIQENYPESRIDQLESPEDARRREQDVYDRVRREIDGDEDFGDWEDDE